MLARGSSGQRLHLRAFDEAPAIRGHTQWRSVIGACRLVLIGLLIPAVGSAAPAGWLSPTAIVAAADGNTLYVACATGDAVLVLDAAGTVKQRITMPASPSGLALSADGTQLAVTCAAPQSTVCVVDTASARIVARVRAGHTAVAPVFSADAGTLYVCNRFNHEIAVFDLRNRKQVARIAVDREPIAAALTRDGKQLLVANHLHNGPATAEHVAAVVSVIDTASRRVTKKLKLPNGSGLLLGVAVTPDGRHAAITHNLGRFNLPTTQLERGWMNTSAMTIVELAAMEVVNTVLLDNVESGAANPWALAFSADGKHLVVTHAGTHELSVIDFPGLLARLAALPVTLPAGQKPDYTKASNVRSDVPNDLAFLLGLRQRVKLSVIAPRSLALAGGTAWAPGYFSDSVDRVDVNAPRPTPASLALGPKVPRTMARQGELWFNDATLCFQGWQSCMSCHSYDARVDGLNWDNLNDGIGNPKNAKSLLWSHRTPPAMSTGVRDTGETAVRAGIRHILFAVHPEEVPNAIDAYLKSLEPVPSPYLENGRLSKAAQRGKKLFEDSRVGCAQCHPAGLFTDMKQYDVGTRRPRDGEGTIFDTPTLVEMWRSGPFLHDGSAATIHEVLRAQNPQDRHGTTSHLSKQQIDDLATYLLSL